MVPVRHSNVMAPNCETENCERADRSRQNWRVSGLGYFREWRLSEVTRLLGRGANTRCADVSLTSLICGSGGHALLRRDHSNPFSKASSSKRGDAASVILMLVMAHFVLAILILRSPEAAQVTPDEINPLQLWDRDGC
jgi:hypothetical protein